MLPEPTKANCTLTDEKVRAEVVALVARHLALEMQGRLVNPAMVAEVLVYAAVGCGQKPSRAGQAARA